MASQQPRQLCEVYPTEVGTPLNGGRPIPVLGTPRVAMRSRHRSVERYFSMRDYPAQADAPSIDTFPGAARAIGVEVQMLVLNVESTRSFREPGPSTNRCAIRGNDYFSTVGSLNS